MQPDDRIRKGGIAVLALYGAGALVLAFAYFIDRIHWRLLHDELLYTLSYRVAGLVAAAGWLCCLAATLISLIVCVYGFRRRKSLTRRGRAIAMACALPPVLALVALALFIALIISFRSSDWRYG